MQTISEPGSCFADACYIALGVPAKIIQSYIKHHFPSADCDNRGYHPTLMNVAMLELYKIGLVQIDATPVRYTDTGAEPYPDHERVVEHLTKWFGRPGFRCVVTGPRADGAEHANAWNGEVWVDPANPLVPLEEPTVNIRSVWVTTIPGNVSRPTEDGESANDQAE